MRPVTLPDAYPSSLIRSCFIRLRMRPGIERASRHRGHVQGQESPGRQSTF